MPNVIVNRRMLSSSWGKTPAAPADALYLMRDVYWSPNIIMDNETFAKTNVITLAQQTVSNNLYNYTNFS